MPDKGRASHLKTNLKLVLILQSTDEEKVTPELGALSSKTMTHVAPGPLAHTCAGVSASLIGCPSNLNRICLIDKPWKEEVISVKYFQITA